jgi:hypothetical protein
MRQTAARLPRRTIVTPPPWQQEIIELHEFFAQWFGGSLPDTDAAFARFADTMATEFVIIAPTGTLLGRAELLPRLRAAHGSSPGCQIWIERPALRDVRRCLGRDVRGVAAPRRPRRHRAPEHLRLPCAARDAERPRLAARPRDMAHAAGGARCLI